ncbi:MAG TPA: hypothetical protein VK543_08985, partial [Puia sp.]|nr:hypothetical protein [Puia sp.]
MLDFAQNLYEELLFKLDSTVPDLKTFSPDQRLGLILRSIDQLKEKLKSYTFHSEEEEISFFRSRLPLFLSLFLYYSEKFDLESVQLAGTPQSRLEYFDRQFSRVGHFFIANAEFF